MDGSVGKMSNADRSRSRRGLPMSDGLVVTSSVGRHAPGTSSYPSLAHSVDPQTHETVHAARLSFPKFEFGSPDKFSATHFENTSSSPKILRNPYTHNRLQNPAPKACGARPKAPPSVRAFMSAANENRTHAPSDLVVCRQHTQLTTKPLFSRTTDPTPPHLTIISPCPQCPRISTSLPLTSRSSCMTEPRPSSPSAIGQSTP
jgi:hypothetical protein